MRRYSRGLLTHVCCACLVAQSCPTLCGCTGCCPPGFSMGILQARILKCVAMTILLGDLPNSGIEPRSPTLQVDSLQSEPPGQPKGLTYTIHWRFSCFILSRCWISFKYTVTNPRWMNTIQNSRLKDVTLIRIVIHPKLFTMWKDF